MFDEYDEGTAILPAVALKRNLPSGGEFIALDADGDLSLPSDWYLKIAAFAAEAMRGQREVEKTLPRKMLLGDYWGSRKHGPATSSSGTSGSTATHVPNQTKTQVPAPTRADTGFWKDIKDIKDDELPPPAYTLEAEQELAQAKALSATNAPSAANPTSRPPLSAVMTAGDSSQIRVSTVPTYRTEPRIHPHIVPHSPRPRLPCNRMLHGHLHQRLTDLHHLPRHPHRMHLVLPHLIRLLTTPPYPACPVISHV